MNQIQLIGRITKDILLRGSEEKPYCYLTLAVKRKFGDKTDFIDCVANGNIAKRIDQYVKKGHQLGIVGRLQVESKKQGNDWKTNSTVVIEDITFIQPKEETNKINESEWVEPIELESEEPKKEKTFKSFFDHEENEHTTPSELPFNPFEEESETKQSPKDVKSEIDPFTNDFSLTDEDEDDPLRLFDEEFHEEGFDLELDTEE